MKRGANKINKNTKRLDKQRIDELEELLCNIKLPNSDDDKPKKTVQSHYSEFTCTNENNIRNACMENTTANKNEGLTTEKVVDSYDGFITYDEIECVDSANIATLVSCTDMRTGYYDLPKNYRESASKLSPSITNIKQKTSDFSIEEENSNEVSEEQLKKCLEIYSKLKFVDEPIGLNFIIETMPKFQNQYPMYTFTCSKVFRRDEYKWHCQNIHGDIQSSLNGHLMTRCPLAYYGCPYVRFNFKPKGGHIKFSRMFRTFTASFDTIVNTKQNENAPGLLDLPYDCLVYIMKFLDSISLNSMGKTCNLFRDICFGLLDNRGIIITIWKKKTYENSGSSSWREDKQIRFFSAASSAIQQWMFTNEPSVGQHLTTCPFFMPNRLHNRIKLAASDQMKTELLEPYIPKDEPRIEQKDFWQPRTPSDSEDDEVENFNQHVAM